MGIGIVILNVGRHAATDIYRRLMDSVDGDLVDHAEAVIAATTGVVAVDRVRLRWIGHELHAEAEVTVAAALTVTEAHDILENGRHQLMHELERLADAQLHANPSCTGGGDPDHLTRHHFSAP